MPPIPKLDETHLQAICSIICDSIEGLTGSQIGELLRRCRVDDPNPGVTKRVRLFQAFRNPTGHAPKITWVMSEQDALDLLSLVSYLHRRLDAAAIVPQGSHAD